MNQDCSLSPYTKINSKWTKDINIRPETINCTEENMGNQFMYLGLREDFNEFDLKGKVSKAKMKEWDYIKLKSFCKERETFNKTKR